MVFSDQLSTDVRFDTTQNGLRNKAIKEPAGDGTVSAASGACPDLPRARVRTSRNVPNLEHSLVYADFTFNRHVVNLLGAIFGGVVGPIAPAKR